MTVNPSTMIRVVVIGGGYAGTLAANHLRLRADIDIALVNPRPVFVERLRLHQFVAHTHEATIGYESLLGKGIRLIVDRAVRIDTAARTVELESGPALDYDYVVYAVGSTATAPASVPGVTEHAYPLGEWEYARRLRAALDAAPANGPITVVGAGLTGIETAAEIAEQSRTVTLVTDGELAPAFLEPARRSVARWLAKNRVNVLENTRVTELRPGVVALADGSELRSAITIWTTGFGVPDLAAHSGLRTDPLGRLVTDETLTSIDDDRIVGAGDAVAPSGRALRMSCYAAGPLAVRAVNNVLARLAGTEPKALAVPFVGSTAGLGRRAGVLQFARRDDTPVRLFLGGRMGGLVKKAGLTAPMWGLRIEARRPGSVPSMTGFGGRRGPLIPDPEAVMSR
jgi:NADH dehydrogenase